MVSGINADQLRSAVARLAAGEPPVFIRLPLSDGVTRNLAQTVADKNRGDYLKRRHWLRLAAACGLGAAPIIRRVRALATRVLANVDRARMDVEAMPAGGDPALPMIVDAVAARCRAILAGLDDMEGIK